jgi:small GTP-binding protein
VARRRARRRVPPGWQRIISRENTVIQKKLALLGASGVGKTSLVRRFVESLFDEKYLSTIGVKVDKKQVRVDDQDLTLMLWDVAGAEEQFSIPAAYVRGAAGYLLVVDGTRPETLAGAADISEQMRRALGPLPFVLVLNKHDLVDDWKLHPGDLEAFRETSPIVRTSAKTGEGVEDAFLLLAKAIL